MFNSKHKYYVQNSLSAALRKKPRYDYNPEEITTNNGKKDKSITLNKMFGAHKRNQISVNNYLSLFQFLRLFSLCFKVSGHFNSVMRKKLMAGNGEIWAQRHWQKEDCGDTQRKYHGRIYPHVWMALLIQWTWVWANSRRWWRTEACWWTWLKKKNQKPYNWHHT